MEVGLRSKIVEAGRGCVGSCRNSERDWQMCPRPYAPDMPYRHAEVQVVDCVLTSFRLGNIPTILQYLQHACAAVSTALRCCTEIANNVHKMRKTFAVQKKANTAFTAPQTNVSMYSSLLTSKANSDTHSCQPRL